MCKGKWNRGGRKKGEIKEMKREGKGGGNKKQTNMTN